MLSGRLAKPDTNPIERTTRRGYHLRLPERGATAKPSRFNAISGYPLWLGHDYKCDCRRKRLGCNDFVTVPPIQTNVAFALGASEKLKAMRLGKLGLYGSKQSATYSLTLKFRRDNQATDFALAILEQGAN